MDYVRKLTNKKNKTTAYIAFTNKYDADNALSGFKPEIYGSNIQLRYAAIQPTDYYNPKIKIKDSSYYYGKDIYDTPTSVSEAWSEVTPPNQQTQNIIDEVFNNMTNIRDQNWADLMENDTRSSKSPTKKGDITKGFENFRGKAS